MENIIRQVIETEYRAQKIIDEAANDQKQAAYNVEREVEKIREEILCSARQKAEDIKARKLAQAEKQAREILSRAKESDSRMRKKLTENKEAWVKYLFEKTLSLDG